MALQRTAAHFRKLTSEELSQWREIPPAVASDCMNRSQSMNASIKSVNPSMSICGQARTVVTMAGDCGSICELICIAEPGEVIVVDAGGVEDTAVWGGMMAEEAVYRKLGGAVVNGAIRDVSDMRRLQFGMFCKAIVPRGPHQGFGGMIDGAIAVAGAVVRPGDIVLGDDDGVVVVPLERAAAVLLAAQAHLRMEAECFAAIRRGELIPEIFNMPKSELV